MGGTAVVFPIRQRWPGYLCTLALFAGSGWFVPLSTLCHAKICVLWASIVRAGVTQHRRGRVRSYLKPVILSSHLAVNCLLGLRFTMHRVFSVGSCVSHNHSLELLWELSRTVCWLNKFPVSSSSLSSSEIYLLGWILLERKQIVFHSNSSSVVTKSSRRCKVTPTSVTGSKISLAVFPCNGF